METKIITAILAFSAMLVSGYGYAIPSLMAAYGATSGSATTPPMNSASGASGLSGASGSSGGKGGAGGAATSVIIGHVSSPPPPPKPKPTSGGSSGGSTSGGSTSGGSSSGSGSSGAKYCNPSGCKGDPGYYTTAGHHHCYDGYPGCVCTTPSKCGTAYGKT